MAGRPAVGLSRLEKPFRPNNRALIIEDFSLSRAEKPFSPNNRNLIMEDFSRSETSAFFISFVMDKGKFVFGFPDLRSHSALIIETK